MKEKISAKSYFELTEHNMVQVIIFATLAVVLFLTILQFSLPLQLNFFENFLLGDVHYNGEAIPYSFNSSEDLSQPSLYFSWAIDFDAKTANPLRYWYNPTLSVFLIVLLLSCGLTTLISSVLPRNLGFIRQKIERETISMLEKLAFQKYGNYGETEQTELYALLESADLQQLNELAKEFNITLEDIQTLVNALNWLHSSFFYRLLNFNKGIKIYMRFHFTVKYSNTMLGLVYIGASTLIVTIGLRGIKFIPPSQPSYILCSLCLEFSLLLVFALTTIYQRQEEDSNADLTSTNGNTLDMAQPFAQKYHNIGQDYGTGKEVEQLLRMFIKSNSNNQINKGN